MEQEKKNKKNEEQAESKKEVEVTNEEVKEEAAEENFLEKLNKDLEEQRKRADEYYDNLMRNMAEFDNFKKRIAKERESMYTSTVCDVVGTLLPVIDNFEKAVFSECKDLEYKNGIELIYKDLMCVLKKYNIEAIPDVGSTFDPTYHEAVMSTEDKTKGEKEIVEVFRRGYKLGDKVVRHSLVKVAN